MKTALLFFVIVLLQFSCKKDNPNLPAAEEYCVWKIDDRDYLLTSPKMERNYAAYDSLTQIYFQEANPLLAMEIIVIGDRKQGAFTVNPNGFYSYAMGKAYSNKSECSVTVSKWGTTDDYLIGSFKGDVIDGDSIDHTISGNFKIKVTN